MQVFDRAGSEQDPFHTEEFADASFASFRVTSPLISLPTRTSITSEPGAIPDAPLLTSVPTPVTEPLKTQHSHSFAPSAWVAKRALRIPASHQKPRTTGPLEVNVHRRLNPHLRHSLALAAAVLVMLFTLVSLVPLDNGQSALPLFRGMSAWVQAQQVSWNVQAQTVPPTPTLQTGASQSSNTQYQPSLPPDMNLPSSQYVSIAQQDALNAGIPADYFTRQINQESGFNPYAYSPSGAEGIAQFMPATAAGLGINPWDPMQALNGAAHLMASYARNYGGNYAMALAAYNAGSGAIQYAIQNCGSNWISCLPGQTQNYIYVIMGI